MCKIPLESDHLFSLGVTQLEVMIPQNRSILKRNDSSVDMLSSRQKLSKQVSFNDVQIRDYDVTIGDHPDCSIGPPISLGWDFKQSASIDLEEYETHRAPRRSLRELVLNYYHRMHILEQDKELSEKDIILAVKKVNRAKFQRKCTRAFLPVWKLEDIAQSAKRKMKKIAEV